MNNHLPGQIIPTTLVFHHPLSIVKVGIKHFRYAILGTIFHLFTSLILYSWNKTKTSFYTTLTNGVMMNNDPKWCFSSGTWGTLAVFIECSDRRRMFYFNFNLIRRGGIRSISYIRKFDITRIWAFPQSFRTLSLQNCEYVCIFRERTPSSR